MKIFAAGEAKMKFGLMLDLSQRTPIIIQKHGRDFSVMLSIEDFKHFQALEDKAWATEAQKAEQTGFLTAKDSETFLNSLG